MLPVCWAFFPGVFDGNFLKLGVSKQWFGHGITITLTKEIITQVKIFKEQIVIMISWGQAVSILLHVAKSYFAFSWTRWVKLVSCHMTSSECVTFSVDCDVYKWLSMMDKYCHGYNACKLWAGSCLYCVNSRLIFKPKFLSLYIVLVARDRPI